MSMVPSVDVCSLLSAVGSSPVGPVIKFGVAFPLVYHYMGGVRHLIWDKTPETLDNESVHKSSLALAASAVLVSGGLVS